ncbi:TonB-dependent receptor [Pseudohalioglobus sediminis]|jgi:iron complex outermembrane receptor protein|uniref:TonB-dependent receptor n=1 Tax=Pseudohalioglobus sediminis TaxID=2606449 RepID=A0A5B0X1V8_9GAMM|nr:TonB-dependent receptor [Pseudohalioglobus sediminis]KAA1192658.1 TonB-dependent receptor [Pseudohalioglobus sediminis]
MPKQRVGRLSGNCVRGIAALFMAQSTMAGAQTVLEEITVTATKREENVQDVSISMTAMTGDMIEAFGFQDALEVFNQIPNVFADEGSFSGALTIRGNATLNPTLAGEGNVALYFDDVYRPQAYYGGNNLLDLERVEVLRGPQGTLFGRNSTSGLVHFISRKPTEEFEGYATLEVGSYDTRIIEAAISGPINDTISGRLAVQYHEDDGFQENLGPAGGDLAKTDRLTGRGHLNFELGERADLLLTVEASDRDDVGKGFHYWGLLDPVTLAQCDAKRIRAGACVGGGGYFGLPAFGDPDLDPEKVYTELDPDNGENSYTLETSTGIARLNYSLTENIGLVSITAYETMSRFFNPDEDASATGVFGGQFQLNDHYSQDSDQFTQELRLEGAHDGLEWTAGFFYFDEDRDATSTVKDFETVQSPDTIVEASTESWAVFGQAAVTLGEQFRLIGGLRYTEDDKETEVLTAGVRGSDELSSTSTDGKIGLEWRPREDWMFYGTISTAFRSGNFNTDLLFGDISLLTSVKPEEVENYEAGFKLKLADGRAIVNGALFYQEVSDKQGISYDNALGAPAARLISIGDAKIQGAELEVLAAPIEQLELSLGVGWLDGEYEAPEDFYLLANFGTGDRAFQGDQYFIDGSSLGASAPEWTVNGVVRYHLPTGDYGASTLQLDFNYRDATEGIGGNDITYSEDRLLTNLRLFWNSPSERWQVEAYVENIFEEEYIDNMYALSGVDYASGNMGRPRWYGVKLGVNF